MTVGVSGIMLSVSNEESGWTGGIMRGAAGMRKRRDIYGSTVRFAHGDSIVMDNVGGLVIKNQHGRIIKTIDRHDQETRFGWDLGGELTRIDFPDGQCFAKIEFDEWIKVHPDQIIERTAKAFAVLPDGTLRTTCYTNNGVRYYRDARLDGSEAVINENGRITAVTADLKVQTARFYAVLEHLHRDRHINYVQRQGACDALYGILRRVSLEEITELQAAQTLYHLCRLLESCSTSALGAQCSYMLSREILLFAASPDLASAEDGLSTLIRELYRRHPEQVANLVADMGVEKSYATMNGVVVEYVDELMHPTARRLTEWTISETHDESVESSRFVRVVLVNILEKSRLQRITKAADAHRSLSTREFGRVKSRELADVYEQITGFAAEGISFKAPNQTDLVECSIGFSKGQNKSSEVA
jgi:YD repeat-containing protein